MKQITTLHNNEVLTRESLVDKLIKPIEAQGIDTKNVKLFFSVKHWDELMTFQKAKDHDIYRDGVFGIPVEKIISSDGSAAIDMSQ